MQTNLTTDPEAAAAYLRRGEVVAFPTETVYGLGADAFDAAAVHKIFDAKGRPGDNPLIIHLARIDQLDSVATYLSPTAEVLLKHFVPGPLTLILPKHPAVPSVVTGALYTVGVRIPAHPVAQTFLDTCDRPVAAPSANRSGRPSPTTWQAVQTDLDGRIACILQGDQSEAGLESTVVDCTQEMPVVLRAGVISIEELREVLPDVRHAEENDTAIVRSPGTRYRHYAPRARVRLVNLPTEATPSPASAYIGLDATPSGFGLTIVCDSLEAYAHALFDFFRRCDILGIRVIYCQRVSPTGLGRALMDRMQRAAAATKDESGG